MRANHSPRRHKLPTLRFQRESSKSPWKFVAESFDQSMSEHAGCPEKEDGRAMDLKSIMYEDLGDRRTFKIPERLKQSSRSETENPDPVMSLRSTMYEDPDEDRGTFKVPEPIKRRPITVPKKVERSREQERLGPQVDSCVIPEHLRAIVKQDYFDRSSERGPVKPGYVHKKVTDKRLARSYLRSPGQDPNLEVVRYSGVSAKDNKEKPELHKKRLYSRDRSPKLASSISSRLAVVAEDE